MADFKKQRKFLSVLAAIVMLSPCVCVLAEDEDLQEQLSSVQGQMAEQAQKKSEAEAVIGSVNERLRTIQIQVDAAAKALQEITEQLAQTERKMEENQRILDAEKKKLAEREAIFSRRIRDIYMHGQLNYVDVVLGARDFNDFANRIELLRRIVAADMDLITGIKEQRDKIAVVQTELEAERARQAALRDDAARKKDEIEEHKREQQAVLYQAEHDKALAEEAYRELEASSASIGELLRQRAAARAAAQQPSASSDDYAYQPVSGTGVFVWPVNGVITSPYGYRVHPIFGSTIYHSGMDIGVDEGTPVHAADAGVVVEADWISGYGYAVIIDHGNGLSTLYGHNSALAVSAGQTVSQGEVIAYAGSTGNSTGPHVHFEVRVNGDTADPMAYL